jgi:Recombination endonuclease VII
MRDRGAYERAYYAKNRKARLVTSRAQYKKHREKRLANLRQYRIENWERLAAKRRKKMGQPEPTGPYPNACEICEALEANQDKGLMLDHDHKTGLFRGWLCSSCNLGLGKLGDSLEQIERTLRYMQRAYRA